MHRSFNRIHCKSLLKHSYRRVLDLQSLSSLSSPSSSFSLRLRFMSTAPSSSIPPPKEKENPKEKKEKKKGAEKFADAAASAPTVPSTPPGQLKDFSTKMADVYYPGIVESAWDSWWEQQGIYKPEINKISKEHTPHPHHHHHNHQTSEGKTGPNKFVMVIPPPNVTGTLHLGHSLMSSIEDCLTRWHRMQGKESLWLPGTDHAGIATQVVVEKKIAREQKTTRHEMGREKFIQEVWKWKEQSGGRIIEQLKRMGASADWSRLAFTMDDNLSEAVKEAFIRMFNKGLIYRSNRIVNWSCTLRTAISSIEVEHTEVEGSTLLNVPGYSSPIEVGVLHSFSYPLEDQSGDIKEITVATTRIETMLGDTAVAVNSKDPRYTSIVGKKLRHPFIPDRAISIITDDTLVDMKFGTGAVKVTPAHDPNDFLCGTRNKLEFINIFNDDGLLNEHGGPFKGLKRFDVRTKIIEELTKLGLYKGKANNKMSIGICSRSKDIVEPVIRPQWWVNCQGMAKRAADAVKHGELKLLPSFHEKTWFEWLDNIQDWCISRQLWWGHRIPAYLIEIQGKPAIDDQINWIVAPSLEEAKKAAAAKFPEIPADQLKVTQDPDVLDTWFSSGLFPFSTMGWPKATEDMKNYYPGTLLETGHDILFFWVARMVMMGLELTNQLPFRHVYLHAMVRDKFGDKMSKSKGNVIDPLDVVDGCKLQKLNQQLISSNLDPNELKKGLEMQSREYPDGIPECGADALRFGLLSNSSHGRDINLDVQRVVGYRLFGNKLWQANRFALMKFDENFQPPIHVDTNGHRILDFDKIQQSVKAGGNFGDKWILSRLHNAVHEVNKCLCEYDFTGATTAIYNFWLYELCDIFLELMKPIMMGDDAKSKESSCNTLFLCLDHGLKLLHPMMPFITEELYHRLPQANRKDINGSILLGPYPVPSLTHRFQCAEDEADMKLLEQIAKASRSTKASLGQAAAAKKFDLYAVCATSKLADFINGTKRDLSVMAQAALVVGLSLEKKEFPPQGCINHVINGDIEIFIPLKGIVDFSSELIKIEKSMERLNQSLQQDQKIISDPAFEKKPQAVRDTLKAKAANNQEELSKLKGNFDNFRSLMSQDELKQYKVDKITSLKSDVQKSQQQIDKLKASQAGQKEPQKKVLAQIAELEVEVTKWNSEIERVEKEQ